MKLVMEKLASDFGSGAHPQGKIPIPNPGKNLSYISVVKQQYVLHIRPAAHTYTQYPIIRNGHIRNASEI